MKAARIKHDLRDIHVFGKLSIFFGLAILVSAQDSDSTEDPSPDVTLLPEEPIADINFDLAIKAQLRAFKYRDEEPHFAAQTQFIDNNVEGWSFAYDGGEQGGRRPPNKKAITWGIGILGIDYFGKTYNVTAMGALINPRIIMTLCASVNSFYRSYKGILFEEEASPELFKISNSSDPQFDIRAPEIVAYWGSEEGFTRKTGEEKVMIITRHILTTKKCTRAVDGIHINQTIQQYKSPAFLLLPEPISNPFGGNLPGHLTNFLYRSDDDDVSSEYRRRAQGFPLEMMAYKQRVCHWPPNITQLTSLKVWRTQSTGDIVEPGLHLLNTRWDEDTIDAAVNRPDYSGDPSQLFTFKGCSFFAFDKFREAFEDVGHQWAYDFQTAMVNALNKPDVACLKWHWGNLCDAPPGSPVFYWSQRSVPRSGNDILIGLTLTSPKTLKYRKMDQSVHMFVIMLTHEAGKKQLVEEIKGLVDYVKNLGKTREQATDYPIYEELEEKEKIPLELIGNLDSDVVPNILGKLQQAGIMLSKASRNYMTLVMTVISVIPLCSAS